MFIRLFIIALFLALPIVIALLSQRMADTVAPPALPTTPLEIRLATERPARRQAPPETPPAQEEAPVAPRVIQRAPSFGQDEAAASARTQGAGQGAGKPAVEGGAS